MDPYMLIGDEASALDCLDRARKWLGPERRWKLRLTFLLETASFALMQGNVGLALDLITQLEGVSRGREDAVPMPGPYWKLKAFKMAQIGHSDEAYGIVSSLASQWKKAFVFHYLDMVATKAWLECRENGSIRRETRDELKIFDSIGATGRKELLGLQGFLTQKNQTNLEERRVTSVES
jgi:hypothetical protein